MTENHISYSYSNFKILIDDSIINLVSPTTQKILSFKKLQEGWRYGEGSPPKDETISKALAWELFLSEKQFDATNAFPGTGGEIVLAAYWREHSFEIIIQDEKTFSIIHDIGNKEVASFDCISENEAKDALEQITEKLWNTSGYSIQRNLTPVQINSRVLPLETHQKTGVVGYPSSAAYVSIKPTPTYVNTLGNITLTSPVNPQYFGSSTPAYCPPAAV